MHNDRLSLSQTDKILVSEQSLRRTVSAIFKKLGVCAEDADEASDVLVTSDLRGVESHGVSNMLRAYVADYQSGKIKPDANWCIKRESAATAVVDAAQQLGIIMGPKAMRLAIAKANHTGVGAVTMCNSGHLGAIGHFAMLAIEHDMVGVCMSTSHSSRLTVVPTFASKPMFGTNPIAIAAPADKEAPFLFDAATSVVSVNKLRLAARSGASMAPGWVADRQGRPITDELQADEPDHFFLLPLGGTREQGSHKGYGLMMMAEIMSTLLSGDLPHLLDESSSAKSYFAAYRISAFTDVDRFKTTMDRMLGALRTTAPAEGHERVFYPGLQEFEEMEHRRAHGISLHHEVIDWFSKITADMSLPALCLLD